MDSLHQNLISNLSKNLHFAPITNQLNYQSHIIRCFNELIYAKYGLKQPSIDYLKSQSVKLPELRGFAQINLNKLIFLDNNKKTLFLDLDETLISSTCDLRDPNGTLICFSSENSSFSQISVRMRPHTSYALEILSQYYDIYIFSAGKEAYVNQVVQLLDPENKYICGVLSQSHCLKTKMNHYIKDLRIISNRSLSDMLIVDNSICSFAYQIPNGVPIIPWNGELDDNELLGLTNYLIKLASYSNLSQINSYLTNFSLF